MPIRPAHLRSCLLTLLLGSALALGPLEYTPAQEAAPAAPAPATSPIAATVDGKPIYVAQVDALLAAMMKAQRSDQVSPQVRAMALRQIINRTLAARALERDGSYVTDAEVTKALDAVKTQATDQKQTFEEFLARQGVTMDTVRYEMLWQLGWTRYLERNLTDGLETFFNSHRRDFDGTEVRASHVLLRPERTGDSAEQRIARARQIRNDIEQGKLTFEQAVEKYSTGPSRAAQGDLGFFPRYGVMSEEFSKAAFALEKGQLSEPVVSAFGVHLIRTTDVKPGNKQWTEVVEQMRGPAAGELFNQLAKREGDEAKIEFTGRVPYFKPGTEEVVIPPGWTP